MSDKKKISEKDQKDWDDFLKSPLNVSEKEIDKSIKYKNLKFKFDLHGYSIDNANKKVAEIIENCYSKGFSEILLITGKGHHSKVHNNVYASKDFSTLKGTIPEFIKNNSNLSSKILNMKEADENLGGKGALIIKLKKLKNKF